MKNTIVKISLLLVVLAMIVSCFVACGGNAPDTSNSGNQSTDSSNGGSTDNSGSTGSTGSTDNSGSGGGNTDNGQTYTVTFDTTRAQNPENIPDQTVSANGKATKPDYEPYRKGQTFYGWCIDGDQTKLWDFNNSTVTEDITLVAVFNRPGDSGDTSDCEHDFVVTEYEAPTCEAAGKRVEKCSICKKVVRYNKDNDPTLARLEHLELEEVVEPTCAVDGYKTVYCPNGCQLSLTTRLPATGAHVYDPLGWKAVIRPTAYVPGKQENPCTGCGGAVQTKTTKYNASKDQLYGEKVDISFLYTGGKYVNEKFVNVANLGKVLVSSYFDGTKGSFAIDGNTTTFWNADTYVEGADYTSDWLELELAREYEVGAIKLTLPNYYAWELGEDCYVSYNIEYWDSAKEEWVYLCEVSDKNATAVGISCEFMIELAAPITTGKIKASVAHATRYTPAVIYEIETFVKADEIERVPMSAVTSASVSISGKYNEWASGADALKDNVTLSYWYTDERVRPGDSNAAWALYEFPVDTYIACVQFSMYATKGRAMQVEVYKNGAWSTIGTYSVPDAGVTNDIIISNRDNICLFNVNIEDTISKMKFSIVKEPEYWTSYVYDIIPYTISEVPFGEPAAAGCSHTNPRAGEVVPATCGVPGYTVMNCVCGAKLRTKATDALSHDWGKYNIDVAATATSLGTKVSTCRNEGCGATSTMSYSETYDDTVIVDYLHNAPAAWAQTFDDGNYLDTYTWANKNLIKYGARATVMMSITYSDSLVAVWQDHFTKGVFDLGSHSYNHTSIYSGQASADALLSEVVVAQYWFRHNFKGQQLLAFAAPLGATSTSVAEYLAGTLAANRNGGQGYAFYNVISDLEAGREMWGNLNSYISKADQTEGKYVLVGNGEVYAVTTDSLGNPIFTLEEGYDKADVNLIFDFDSMSFVDKGTSYPGSYCYDKETYQYTYFENGSYKKDGDSFVFVTDGSGDFKMIKTTVGSYEKGVEKLVSLNGFTVECLHSVGSGSIHSSYSSTISKLEHITRFGVWAPSYNELVKYLREAESAKVEITERGDDRIVLTVTDSLDDFMFNQALTIKVDIPDSWTSVSATQGGVNIPFVSLSDYKHTKNMPTVSCAIEDGYLYIDVVPDAGEVVISAGEKDNSVSDYKDKVTVTFEPGEGQLKWDEYEARAVVGQAVASYPTPVREGYKFLGWFYDEACTQVVLSKDVYSENTTVFAGWEEIPKCTDNTLNHNFGNWLPGVDGVSQVRTCSKCGYAEYQLIEVPEDAE